MVKPETMILFIAISTVRPEGIDALVTENIAESVNPGPNKEIPAPRLKQAIGADVLAALEQQTGLSPEELRARLSQELPVAVDTYAPDGRIPN